MIDPGLAEEIAETALRKGGVYSDVFCQRREVTLVRYEDGKVDDLSFGVDLGAGIRVIKGDLASFAHTDILDGENMARAARAAADALEYAKPGKEALRVVRSRRSAPPPVSDAGLDSPEINDIVGYLAGCDESARSLGSEIRQVTCIHSGALEEVLLVNSLGESRSDTRRRTRLVVQVVAGRNGDIQLGQEAPGGLGGTAFYDSIDPTSVARTAAERAVTMLGARPSPTGKMAVVVNSGTGGVLFHEACGHGLEADHVHKGASVYAGKLDTRVASPVVSASDNPTVTDLWGSYEFDDEGTPASETVVIEEGVLRSFLYSRHEAMKDERGSTGNGRRESYQHTAIPRMSNTYIRPGSDSPQQIISSTAKGLYAKKMGGGQVDPVTGDYVFSVSEGYLIEGGRIGPAVRGAVLIGNGPRTLELIDAVGDDLGFEEGTCGKEGQGVPVTTGCPTFRITELTVGGTEI